MPSLPAPGNLSIAATALEPDNGVTLTGYTGTVTLDRDGYANTVELDGEASDVLAVFGRALRSLRTPPILSG